MSLRLAEERHPKTQGLEDEDRSWYKLPAPFNPPSQRTAKMYAGVTPPVAVMSVLISCGRTALQEPTFGKLSLFSLKPELYSQSCMWL